MKTTLLCPCCKKPLSFEDGFIFCGNGKCKSESSNNGAKTFEELCAKIALEKDEE